MELKSWPLLKRETRLNLPPLASEIASPRTFHLAHEWYSNLFPININHWAGNIIAAFHCFHTFLFVSKFRIFASCNAQMKNVNWLIKNRWHIHAHFDSIKMNFCHSLICDAKIFYYEITISKRDRQLI